MTLFLSIFTLLSVYRFVLGIREISSKHDTWGFWQPSNGSEWKPSNPEAQATLCVNFLCLMRDLPFLFCGLIVTLLLWRAPFMYYDLYHASSGSEMRKLAGRHFLLLFVDIFVDSPLALLGLIMTVTFWRAYWFWKELVASKTRGDKRYTLLRHFFFWLLDIPTFIAGFFVLITVYRFKFLFLDLKEVRKKDIQLFFIVNKKS